MNTYYNTMKKYDANYYAQDYIAIACRVNWIDRRRDHYEYNLKDEPVWIAATHFKIESKLQKTINKQGSLEVVQSDTYRLCPIIHQNVKNSKNIQRSFVICYAASGSGKSTLLNNMALVYSVLNPSNKIYFVSGNDYNADTSLTHSIYTFKNVYDFLDEYDDSSLRALETDNSFANSLVVFDDVEFADDKKGKEYNNKFMKIMCTLSKFKRKKQCHLILTTHDETFKHKHGKALFNEATMYIMFNTDLKNQSNYILEEYYRLKQFHISGITALPSRWIALDTRMKTVITDTAVYSLSYFEK